MDIIHNTTDVQPESILMLLKSMLHEKRIESYNIYRMNSGLTFIDILCLGGIT
jgi:hypothetical protein